MAASSGGAAARRKRPWRKPREAKGPDEPLRTVRASPLSYITGHVVVEEEARDKVCVEEQPQREEQVVMETENKQTTNRDGDGQRDTRDSGKRAGDSGQKVVGRGRDGSGSSRFLEIDGSIMEGVSLVELLCLIIC